MNTPTPTKTLPTQPDRKPGFFTRIIHKVDDLLKKKADEAARKGSCCGGDKGGSGKCC